MRKVFRLLDHDYPVTARIGNPMEVTIEFENEKVTFSRGNLGQTLTFEGDRRHSVQAVRSKDRVYVWLDGRTFELTELEESTASAASNVKRDDIRAPMPGTIIKLSVAEGDAVEEDQVIIVLEAMKMEHNLRAPRSGKVASVNAREGQIVTADAILVHLEPQ